MQIWRNLIKSEVLNAVSRTSIFPAAQIFDISPSQQAEPAQMDKMNPSALSAFKEHLEGWILPAGKFGMSLSGVPKPPL